MTPSECTLFIKRRAAALGFDYCGISEARFLEEEARRVENWLHIHMNGQMAWMEDNFEKRLDPTKLVPGARSVVSLLYNYFPSRDIADDKSSYKISKYAYGTDYHQVINNKLRELMTGLQEKVGDINGRVFVDSAPVLERVWAKNSGLGWIGKNTLLLNRDMGSFFFLAEIIIDTELEYDGPVKDYCGTCTRCMDACPTDAFPKPYVLDASRCISYLTIELKNNIPESFSDHMEDWIFGCDICQDVCPWNRFSKPHQEPAFDPPPDLVQMTKKDWEEITEDVFNELFKKSALKRTKYKGLKRNIEFVKKRKR